MEEGSVNVQGHLRGGVAVRPYVRRQLFSRRSRNRQIEDGVQGLAVSADSSPVAPPAKAFVSPEEYIGVAEKEYKKIDQAKEFIKKIFSPVGRAVWSVSNIILGATSLIIGGFSGLAAVGSGLVFAVPLAAYWASKPLLEMYSQRRARKITETLNRLVETPSQQFLDSVNAEMGPPSKTPWKATATQTDKKTSWWKRQKRDYQHSGIEVNADGTAIVHVTNAPYSFGRNWEDYPATQTFRLYPKASFQGYRFPFGFNAKEVDLRGADFQDTEFATETSFRGSILTGANFDRVDAYWLDFIDADLSNASFRDAVLGDSGFWNANITGADFTGAIIRNLRKSNIELSDDQFMSLNPQSFETRDYDRISFTEAIEQLGVTEKQFEFLVLSGALPARNNSDRSLVNKNFNPEEHHVTRWDLLRAKKTLEDKAVS